MFLMKLLLLPYNREKVRSTLNPPVNVLLYPLPPFMKLTNARWLSPLTVWHMQLGPSPVPPLPRLSLLVWRKLYVV